MYVCYCNVLMVMFKVLFSVYIVVIQGGISPDCDVFRDVVISNVSVWYCVGFYGIA